MIWPIKQHQGYINWKVVQRKNVADKADMIKFMGTMTKKPIQKNKQHIKKHTEINITNIYPHPPSF